MYTARIKNARGEELTLTGTEDRWQIESIDGLDQVKADLNLTGLAGLDGARFNSASLNTRNIVITLALRGNIEVNRLRLYRFFQTKEKCTFFFSNEHRDVSISGYVESFSDDLFQKRQKAQISIICPDPYFRNVNSGTVELSYNESLFEFPFAISEEDPVEISDYAWGGNGIKIVNNSESRTGVIITVYCITDISTFTVEDATTGERMTLAYDFFAGDTVTINTEQGQKSVRLRRADVESNIFFALNVLESTFLQLTQGENYFHLYVDGGPGEGKVKAKITYAEKYRGV